MDVIVDLTEWAKRSFGAVDLGNRQSTKRLVFSAAKIAAHPEKSFPQIFDWNQLRGFYRVCDKPTATQEAIMQPHWQQTRQAMARHKTVLILHDTTMLDFTDHPALEGVGPIGDGHGSGFLQHNSLAILPAPRQVLGLAFQQLTVRHQAPEKEHPRERKKRQRESDLWLNGIRGVGEAPSDCCWVDVGDRGCDIYEAMVESRKLGHHFLFRVTQNRQVFTTATLDQQVTLIDFARTLPSQGSDVVEITGRGGRPARTAKVKLAAAPVWVPAPHDTPERKSQPVVPAWVIRIWEPHPPGGSEERIEWLLLCSVPTQTLEELKERRDWYSCRWLVEVYHDIEKNGCSEEDRRFETAERMEACLAILSIVAVRVFQLRCALEWQPEEPAWQVGTAAEIALIRRVSKHKGRTFTVRDFVRGVAKLGGFLGRKSDGNPGVSALWRGYQRLQDMMFGYGSHVSADPEES
jgi:hypothetical protein